MTHVSMTHMIIGIPDSTFFIVFGSFAVCACLLLIWAFTFRSDIDAE
jgi:hypothetical protein